MEYKKINRAIDNAISNVKIEKFEHKHCINHSSFKSTGYPKLYNKALRRYGKAIIKLTLENKI